MKLIDMVAIKDMEMPKNCIECKLFHFYFDSNSVIHCICKCGNMEMCGDLKNKRNDFCPLVVVYGGTNMADIVTPQTEMREAIE